uniref:Uncharacterized protein n=1 Tax=Arundo donax TaxID=35708 RepID=A0A0A9RV10_ARUDO
MPARIPQDLCSRGADSGEEGILAVAVVL